jgi:hypothetical protein
VKLRAVIRKDGTIATDATEGGRHLVSSVYKVMQIGGRTGAEEPLLVPLDEAVRPYHGVTVRMLRARINGGLLPAVKMGRAYLVSPSDVAALLTPKLLATPATKRKRETEHERAVRQLAQAGIT